jgi:hypothetical protein
VKFGQPEALGVIAGALGVGALLATAVGTRLHIHRPALLQAGALVLVTALGVATLFRFNLLMLAALCLVTAMASGLAKLAIDAAIQERIPEQRRASAFGHSETVLMLAWVAGGALGLVPFNARFGVGIAIVVIGIVALRGVVLAVTLRQEKLAGVASGEVPPVPAADPDAPTRRLSRTRRLRGRETRTTKAIHLDDAAEPAATLVIPRQEEDEPEGPGYHLYRPSGQLPPDDDE